MKINKFNKVGNIAEIEIQEDYESIERAINKIYPEISREAKIKGFRQGKVPRPVFERYYGKELLIERASTEVINDCYLKVVKEKSLEVVDYPKDVNISQLEEGKPVIFTLKVEVKPEVKLGKYKGLKAEKQKKCINEEEYNKNIKEMQERFAEYIEISNRPVKEEDIIRYDLKAEIEGRNYENWTRNDGGTRVGLGFISSDFDNRLIGMKMFEEKNFELEFPEDYKEKDIAGKKVEFYVKVKEIREKKLPELNDDLAKKLSQGKYDTWNDLDSNLRKNMEEESKLNAENKLKDDIVNLAAEDAQIDVSDTLINREVEAMVKRFEDVLKQSNLDIDNYLNLLQKDRNMLKEEYRIDAIKKIKGMLVLEEIRKKENIEVTDEDVENEIKKMAEEAKKEFEEYKKNINNDFKNYIKEYLKDNKTIDFLISNAKIKEL